MVLSDYIASMIEEMLDEGGGSAEVKRNDLAARIGCVPSQINYVITSRFTPERGYVIESRRGGGGYIKIIRVQMSKSEYLMHFFQAIGDSIDEKTAKVYLKNLFEHGIITEREAKITASAMSNASLERCPAEHRDETRADMLRRITMLLMM
ncbi:MAG: CtsR family transcriptional regulator [Eubacteriales bacterium]